MLTRMLDRNQETRLPVRASACRLSTTKYAKHTKTQGPEASRFRVIRVFRGSLSFLKTRSELLPAGLVHSNSVIEVVGKNRVNVFAGTNRLVIHAAARAESSELFEIVSHGLEISLTQ